ncbi:MAG: hypothetical protein S4CHLAM37_01370 [Chlamydiia bacterium]|nr:hypothetical protein [Chlamydiia bacterium]
MTSISFTIGHSYGSKEHAALQEGMRAVNMRVGSKAHASSEGPAVGAALDVLLDLDWSGTPNEKLNAFANSIIGDLHSTSVDDLPNLQVAATPLNKSAPSVQKTAEAVVGSLVPVLQPPSKKANERISIGYSYGSKGHAAQLEGVQALSKSLKPKPWKLSEGPAVTVDMDLELDRVWKALTKAQRSDYISSVIEDSCSTPDKVAKVAKNKIPRDSKFSKSEQEYVSRFLTEIFGKKTEVMKVMGRTIRDLKEVKWANLAKVHPKEFPKRTGRELRDLWERRLNPNLKFGPFTEAEKNKLRAMAMDPNYKPSIGTAKYSAIGRELNRPGSKVRYQMIRLGLIEKV